MTVDSGQHTRTKNLKKYKEYTIMLEFLKELAKQAGAIAYADLLQLKTSNIHSKGNVLDLVTDTDRKVENFITSALREHFPDYGIFGEENGKSNADREYCFVIDPIDGTASFVHHLPNWCISIGLFHNGKSVAGVIYQPVMDNLFYAEKGKGAYCNGVALHVTQHANLEDCIVGTGFSCLRAQWREENNLKYFSAIAPLVSDIRKYGSAALDCCLVASGSLDAFWELYLQPYDVAAGIIILQEAGGKVTDLKGGHSFPAYGVMATNGVLHDKMLSFFTDYRHLQR